MSSQVLKQVLDQILLTAQTPPSMNFSARSWSLAFQGVSKQFNWMGVMSPQASKQVLDQALLRVKIPPPSMDSSARRRSLMSWWENHRQLCNQLKLKNRPRTSHRRHKQRLCVQDVARIVRIPHVILLEERSRMVASDCAGASRRWNLQPWMGVKSSPCLTLVDQTPLMDSSARRRLSTFR